MSNARQDGGSLTFRYNVNVAFDGITLDPALGDYTVEIIDWGYDYKDDKRIPYNFEGIMGVPITFLSKYNPEQFKIIGADYQVKDGELAYIANKKWKGKLDRAYLNGKRLYSRIFIKNILKEGVNNAI